MTLALPVTSSSFLLALASCLAHLPSLLSLLSILSSRSLASPFSPLGDRGPAWPWPGGAVARPVVWRGGRAGRGGSSGGQRRGEGRSPGWWLTSGCCRKGRGWSSPAGGGVAGRGPGWGRGRARGAGGGVGPVPYLTTFLLPHCPLPSALHPLVHHFASSPAPLPSHPDLCSPYVLCNLQKNGLTSESIPV